MLVKELQAKQGNVDMKLDVVEIGPTREFQKFGKPGKVATATAKDESGSSINLTLWNEDISKVKAGDKVHLTNGYVSEWQGELQLTTGRMGKIEIVGKADIQDESKKEVFTNRQNAEEDADIDEENIEEI